MNAMVNFRANGLGNLSISREKRQAAQLDIQSTYRAKVLSILKGAGQSMDDSAKTAAVSKTTETKAADGEDTGASSVPKQEMGRDAFLQLLVLQLQNQDPMEPVDNTDMIAQLAQFSALEAMENLNGSFETLSGNVDQLNFISAQGLRGKYIEGMNSDGEVVTGQVDSVYLDGSIVVLNVEGEIIPMSGVMSIMNEAPEED